MLMKRIVAAFTFKKEGYAEVEHDESFTTTAWMIVGVVALLNAIGSNAAILSSGKGFLSGFAGWIGATIVGALFAVGGFALGAFIISWIGKAMFQAEVTFQEMVRTLGLAYVWNAIGFIGIVSGIIPFLGCVLAPVIVIASLMGLVAWLFAAKEALDLEWGQTAIVVVIGFVATFIISLIGGAIIGLFGFTASAATGLLG